MTAISIIIAILVFGIIVLVHEWGHFIVARRVGVIVQEFAIGMGPKLIGHTSKKGTLYSLRLLPIGVYCKMLGEDEAVDEEGSYSSKSVPARMAIVAAGPLMNFVLAFVILLFFCGIYGYTTTYVNEVEADYPAAAAGLESGDRFLSINGHRVHLFNKISYLLSEYQEGDTVTAVVEKPDGTKKELEFKPKYDEAQGRYRMGFSAKTSGGNLSDVLKSEGIGALPSYLGGMISNSFWTLCFDVELTVRGFVQLITGQVGADAVAGPIGIVTIIGDSYEQGLAYGFTTALYNVFSMIVLLSVNLGALNLFPIPALDGSRLVFHAIEGIRRKPVNPKVENAIYMIGFVLLMILMVVIAFSDIRKLL